MSALEDLRPPRRFVWIWWEDTTTDEVGFFDERGREQSTGSVWLDDGHGDPGDEPNWFMWDEGNYSCDCNRAILFLGLEMDEVKCGDGRFEILVRGLWPDGDP